MKEIDIEELKRVQLEILLKVDEFCTKNGIEYSLDSGTLLGAIRHKGYIPWDDDIDIIMTRPNYERFLNSFNNYCDYLKVYSPEIDWRFYAPYANVCDERTVLYEHGTGHNGIEMGVKIDVFPIDGSPSNYNDYIRVYNKIAKLNAALIAKRKVLSEVPLHRLRYICALICRKIYYFNKSYSDIQKEIHELATSVPFSSNSNATQLVYVFYPLYFDKPIFNNYINVEFEGHSLKAIEEYDTYLKCMYGDYMQLPPEDQRVYNHGFKAYWK